MNFQVMQKSCRCGFMYGELTNKETISRIEQCLEGQLLDQFEILLYKKNSKPNMHNLFKCISLVKRIFEKIFFKHYILSISHFYMNNI